MSMLSAQCDELRKAAQTYRDLGNYETEQLLLDAADTILSLRDMAQDLRAENARLRSELDSVGTAAYLYGRSDLQAENADLRELVRDMWGWLTVRTVSGAALHDISGRMHELGIEVTDD